MKRLITISLLVVIITALSSCTDNSAHTHDYSSEWVTNTTHHWKSCSKDECDSIVASSEHSFSEGIDLGNGNTKHVCSVCLFEKTTHEHNIATEYSKDESYHWLECLHEGCDYYGTKTEHSFGSLTLDGENEVRACQECGYKEKKLHSHSYTGAMVSEEN